MPIPVDRLTHTKRSPGEDGLTFVSEHPNPLFDELSDAISQGDTSRVHSLAAELLPLPNEAPTQLLGSLSRSLKVVVTNKDYDLLDILLRADPSLTRHRASCYAIDAAADSEDFPSLQMFLDAGWDINESGQFLLKRPLLKFGLAKPELRSWLLQHGANANGQDHWSVTNLESAAMHADKAVAQDLLNHGGDPASDDSLIIAAGCGNAAVAELLIQHGADANKAEKVAPTPGEPRRRGETALHKALMPAMTQGPRMVDLLLANGANIEAKDDEGRTPLIIAKTIAEKTGNDALVRRLEARQT